MKSFPKGLLNRRGKSNYFLDWADNTHYSSWHSGGCETRLFLNISISTEKVRWLVNSSFTPLFLPLLCIVHFFKQASSLLVSVLCWTVSRWAESCCGLWSALGSIYHLPSTFSSQYQEQNQIWSCTFRCLPSPEWLLRDYLPAHMYKFRQYLDVARSAVLPPWLDFAKCLTPGKVVSSIFSPWQHNKHIKTI